MLSKIQKAIIQTLAYHARFNYPLTIEEIHRLLITSSPVSRNKLEKVVGELVNKRKVIKLNNKYFPNLPNLPNLPKIRAQRSSASQKKLIITTRAAKLFAFIPWVKLICVTGSLAMENSGDRDDIDLMIVTTANRLWLTRPLIVLLAGIFFKRRKPIRLCQKKKIRRRYLEYFLRGGSRRGAPRKGPLVGIPGGKRLTGPQIDRDTKDSICLNLWLDENALLMPASKRTLRIAHELAQMKPLANKNQTYEKMLRQNNWGSQSLANFWRESTSSPNHRFMDSSVLNLLNKLFFKLQYRYMKPRITDETISLHSAFFHPARRLNVPLTVR